MRPRQERGRFKLLKLLKRAAAVYAISLLALGIAHAVALRYMSCESLQDRVLAHRSGSIDPISFACAELYVTTSDRFQFAAWLILLFVMCLGVAVGWNWIDKQSAPRP